MLIDTLTDKRNATHFLLLPDFVALMKSLEHAIFINEVQGVFSVVIIAVYA